MKFTDVLVATDLNPLYYKCIPVFIETWEKLFHEIKIHIILIADEIIDELIPYKKYIKLFNPIQGMYTAFTAQTIRILYPALINTTGGILITDMDMIPMGRKYYTEQIKDIDDSKFICYRPLSCVGENEMVICYNIAHSNVWSEIFNIHTINDIKNVLISIYKNNHYENRRGGSGWNLDQLYLYKITQEWNRKTNSLIILNKHIHVIETSSFYNNNNYSRLWRYYPVDTIKYCLLKDLLVDFHIPKPYNKSDINYVTSFL
jgi:hypothetical protein